ncbi:hypothetical protein QNH98_01780 [Myroides sp. mNGS23_01]|nr:hypothetical protein [Myroides sp. mNGS23_01]WHT39460.1 hypothetical protein QNH98_01780 [Myroides sp. mNGS23_01]
MPGSLKSEEKIQAWIESAILIKMKGNLLPKIDFYYTHDKDFSLSILNLKLHEDLQKANEEIIHSKILSLLKTESGKSALIWFLTCTEFSSSIQRLFQVFISDKWVTLKDEAVFDILSNSILNQIGNKKDTSFEWLEESINYILSNQLSESIQFKDNLKK